MTNYKEVAFGIIAHQDKIDVLSWEMRKKIYDKFCSNIKRLYGCEISYSLGDGIDSYFCFSFSDKRLLTPILIKSIKNQIKSVGDIINEFYFTTTKYNSSILKHFNSYKSIWSKYTIILDSNMGQYKKVFGSNWYISTYTNNVGEQIPHKYSYLFKSEIYK
jgi:hypothetical protein